MTDKPTCSSCKWWECDPKAKDGYPSRFCVCPRISYGASGDAEGDTAQYDSYEGQGVVWNHNLDYPRFVTGPDFGCIHHEPKEQGNAN